MSKQSPKKSSSQAPALGYEWRSHPVVIAAGTCAATVVICVAIFMQVVLPTQEARLQLQIDKANNANEQLRSIVMAKDKAAQETADNMKGVQSGLSSLEHEVAELKATNSQLNQALVGARVANLFSIASPYPNGFGTVRIGMSKQVIWKTYPMKSIKVDSSNPEFVDVTLANTPFDTATYFLSKDSKDPKITEVSFSISPFASKYADDFVFTKLVQAFGKPRQGCEKTYFSWGVGKDFTIFANDKRSFTIMRRGEEPFFWVMC